MCWLAARRVLLPMLKLTALQRRLSRCQWSRVGQSMPPPAAGALRRRHSSHVLPRHPLTLLSKTISQAFQAAISQSVALMLRKGPRFLIQTAHIFQPHIPEEEKGRSCLSRIAAPLLTPQKVPPFFLKFLTLLIHQNLLWHRTGGAMYPVMTVLLNHLQSHCWYTLPDS